MTSEEIDKVLTDLSWHKVLLSGPGGRTKTAQFVGISEKAGNKTVRVKYPDGYDDVEIDRITGVKVEIVISVNSL